jgi:thiamine pyrophosphokinase
MVKKMRALILVNGELYKPEILQKRINTENFDVVIGVDGGARYADTLSTTLDAIVGDLDSLLNFRQKNRAVPEVVSYPMEKDEIDLELALDYAEKHGVDQIVMVGVMGGRMDMTIANIMLLSQKSLDSYRIEIWHGQETGWLIKPPGENITGNPGDRVSFIPIGGSVSNATTDGFKYPLKNEDLPFGRVRGVSNIMNGSSASIEFTKGYLLAIHSPIFNE